MQKYIGEFKDGVFEDRQPNGQGTITYPNGRKYVGGMEGWVTIWSRNNHFSLMEECMLGNGRMGYQFSFPVIGQETGVLFLREVNDKWGWFEDGNKDKDAKYIGEFKDGFF